MARRRLGPIPAPCRRSRARQTGGAIAAVDVTLICERPKIGPHRAAMVERVAAILGIAPDARQRQGDDDREARLHRPRRRHRRAGGRDRAAAASETAVHAQPDARTLAVPAFASGGCCFATWFGSRLAAGRPPGTLGLAGRPALRLGRSRLSPAASALADRRRCRLRRRLLGGGQRSRRRAGIKDPGFIVIDEVAAQWLVLLAAPLDWRCLSGRLPAVPPVRHLEAVAGRARSSARSRAGSASCSTMSRPRSTPSSLLLIGEGVFGVRP